MAPATYSMTGYGEATTTISGLSITCSLKTLNSKHLDLCLDLPHDLGSLTVKWRTLLAKALKRGKIEVALTIGTSAQTPHQLQVESIQSYYHTFAALAASLGTTTDLLGWAIQASWRKNCKPALPATPEALAALEALLQTALRRCLQSRAQEGALLSTQLHNYLAILHTKLESVKAHLPARMEAIRKRLEERIALRQEAVDLNRWEQEVLYYLEKLAVEEEIVRLQKHLLYLEETLQPSDQPIGKKLLFILQEIAREVTTLGAKAQDAALQRIVVEMKEATEQMKEQTANLL